MKILTLTLGNASPRNLLVATAISVSPLAIAQAPSEAVAQDTKIRVAEDLKIPVAKDTNEPIAQGANTLLVKEQNAGEALAKPQASVESQQPANDAAPQQSTDKAQEQINDDAPQQQASGKAQQPSTADAQQPQASGKAQQQAGLRFNFERVPWRFVIQWLADEAGLAAHVHDLPTGSFTYSDQRVYQPDEAISRINMFLIPERFALVRADSLLTVINLDSEQSVRQLDALAPLVDVQQIDTRSPHDVVKCIIPLGEVPAMQAIEEVSGLMLMNEPKVLKNTNQLVFTETVEKVRLVRQILNRLVEPILPENGPVERFDLGGLDADRVLAQIRPHVGLDPLAMIGTDIRLSVDDQGRQLLASGSKESLQAIASVLATLGDSEPPSVEKTPEFRSHPMGTADAQTVVSVLQTLLANEEVRLAPDVKSNQLAVLGNDQVHALVENTITQLAHENAVEFRVIPLGNTDPRYAVMILSQMFNIARPGIDGEPVGTAQPANALKIEADPLSQRLFVRGNSEQIAEIEKAIEQLTGRGESMDSQATVGLLPFHGQQAQQILESAAQFWPGKEAVRIVPSSTDGDVGPIEHEINPDRQEQNAEQLGKRLTPEAAKADDRRASRRQHGAEATFAFTAHTQPSAITRSPANAGDGESSSSIKAQVTSKGILVQADSPQKLKAFEDHVRMIAGSPNQASLGLSVFYLKHVQADTASDLLQDILDAQEYGKLSDGTFDFSQQIASYGLTASAANEYWASGTVTVIPDKRLNRIFVYGTSEDQQNVQKHLEVIDRRESLADVQTHGSPRIIKLLHAKAENVAAVVRDAYTGRIAATAKERQAAEQQRLQAEKDSKAKGKTPQPNTVSSQTQSPMMTLAVDEQTNSLVVTAPDQLADEVQEMIATLDEQATQAIEVRSLGATAPQVHELLINLLSDDAKSRSRSSTSSKSSR